MPSLNLTLILPVIARRKGKGATDVLRFPLPKADFIVLVTAIIAVLFLPFIVLGVIAIIYGIFYPRLFMKKRIVILLIGIFLGVVGLVL